MTKMSKLPSQLKETSLRRRENTLSNHRSFTKKKHLVQATKNKELPKTLTMISHLPRDLEEEVFSRLPLTSLRGFRSSCKNWNTLSKDRSFTKKYLARAKAAAGSEFMAVMVMQFRVYLTSVNLHGVHEGVDPSINHQGKLVSLKYSDRVDISRVYHCDGLVLCITKDYTRFVVWNPYLGQTLWVTSPHPILDCYNNAIGYEKRKSHRNYKVLRFVDSGRGGFVEYKIYEFNSNSWRVLDVTCYWYIAPDARGVSIKGNTYWFARHKSVRITHEAIYFLTFLICFDFTSERFGPPLPLPFRSCVEDTVTLSSVREEQLAVLFQRSDTLYMEIWITTKIEPETVLWSKVFLAVDMKPLSGFQFLFTFGSFFIDEEKKLVVVFDKDRDVMNTTRNIAYIIGEDGYFKEVDLGESTDKFRYPVVCSYVPSLVRIKKGGKRKKRT